MNLNFLKKNKKAIQFLVVFVGSYFVFKMAYVFFLQHYYPGSDPFTQLVTAQVVWVLSFFDPTITAYPSQFSEYIAVANDRENMIYLFERFNGVNEFIVYLSFLLAFTEPRKRWAQFIEIGVAGIHLLNLSRLSLLYATRFYFPGQVLFFQKYLFAGIIYVFVFVLWYFWVRKDRKALD